MGKKISEVQIQWSWTWNTWILISALDWMLNECPVALGIHRSMSQWNCGEKSVNSSYHSFKGTIKESKTTCWTARSDSGKKNQLGEVEICALCLMIPFCSARSINVEFNSANTSLHMSQRNESRSTQDKYEVQFQWENVAGNNWLQGRTTFMSWKVASLWKIEAEGILNGAQIEFIRQKERAVKFEWSCRKTTEHTPAFPWSRRACSTAPSSME